MDFLTHLFLPLTVAYVLRRDLFTHPAVFGLAGLGLVSDFDKFLGRPGLLHSALTIVPLCLALLAFERAVRGAWRYAPLASAIAASHLVLDVVDGGPVPLLYPFVREGIGLQYPARTAFGDGLLGLAIRGPLVEVRTMAPRPGFNTYGFIDGQGVAWALAFVVVFVGLNWEERTYSGSERQRD